MAGAKDTVSDDHHPVAVGGVQSVDSSVNRLNRDCPSPLEVSCSICLELVVDDGTRSKAKLQCGHEFHLDCIGSAFNMKGAMQCPNCRNVEKGQWLYANGSTTRPFPEFTMEDWIPEEDLYGISYPEMQYRVHWCPFGELSQAGSFEELEPPTTTYHEYHGHHTVYAEHAAAAAASSVNHSYLAYVGPGPVTTARSGDNNTDDHPWNSHSGQNDHFHQLAVAPQYLGLDHHHHHHHHSPSFSLPHVVAADLAHGEVDSSARGVSYPHPFLFSYRSNPRTSPAIHRHPGSSTQMREHIHTPHAFNHPRQSANGPNLAASPLMAVTRRGVPPPPPPLPLQPAPEQNGGFFIYPPSSSTGERVYVPPHQRAISSFWHRHF